MDGRLKNRLFFLLLGLYLLLLVAKKADYQIIFLSAYLSDLICIPFLLLLMEKVMRFFYSAFMLSVSYAVITCIIILVLFEIILPRYSSAYVADPFDALAYITGTILYGLFFLSDRKKIKFRSKKKWPFPGENDHLNALLKSENVQVSLVL